jgi:hypothetical protein
MPNSPRSTSRVNSDAGTILRTSERQMFIPGTYVPINLPFARDAGCDMTNRKPISLTLPNTVSQPDGLPPAHVNGRRPLPNSTAFGHVREMGFRFVMSQPASLGNGRLIGTYVPGINICLSEVRRIVPASELTREVERGELGLGGRRSRNSTGFDRSDCNMGMTERSR